VVEAMSQCRQPDVAALQKLVEPVGAEIAAAERLMQGRRSAAFNYHKAVAEALPALSWVVYSGPACGVWAPLLACGCCACQAFTIACHLL
jgi:adenylyl cyclase-associated protein